MVVAVPAPAVLIRERDEAAVLAGAGVAAGVGEQHQGEQSGDLTVVGQEPVQTPGQADRLGREVDPRQRRSGGRGVALGEDHVEDVQGRGEALVAIVAREA